MSTYLYYTQGILDFQEETASYSEERQKIRLKRKKYQCPKCKSKDITLEILCERDVRGLPMELIREVHLIYTLHRIYCHRCHERSIEPVSFLSHPKARLSVMFEQMILELREQLSIRSFAYFFLLRWHTVKDIEKRDLRQKFATMTHRKSRRSGSMRFTLVTVRRNKLTSRS